MSMPIRNERDDGPDCHDDEVDENDSSDNNQSREEWVTDPPQPSRARIKSETPSGRKRHRVEEERDDEVKVDPNQGGDEEEEEAEEGATKPVAHVATGLEIAPPCKRRMKADDGAIEGAGSLALAMPEKPPDDERKMPAVSKGGDGDRKMPDVTYIVGGRGGRGCDGKSTPSASSVAASATERRRRRPFAPSLSDYLSPGGPDRYLPKPEWCSRFNSASRGADAASGPAPAVVVTPANKEAAAHSPSTVLTSAVATGGRKRPRTQPRLVREGQGVLTPAVSADNGPDVPDGRSLPSIGNSVPLNGPANEILQADAVEASSSSRVGAGEAPGDGLLPLDHQFDFAPSAILPDRGEGPNTVRHHQQQLQPVVRQNLPPSDPTAPLDLALARQQRRDRAEHHPPNDGSSEGGGGMNLHVGVGIHPHSVGHHHHHHRHHVFDAADHPPAAAVPAAAPLVGGNAALGSVSVVPHRVSSSGAVGAGSNEPSVQASQQQPHSPQNPPPPQQHEQQQQQQHHQEQQQNPPSPPSPHQQQQLSQQQQIAGDGTAVFGKEYNSALHIAVRDDATDAAIDLIRKGASVDFANAKGVTPIILASQKGNFQVVRELLKYGANPLAASQTGSTALIQSSHFGHVDVVKCLLRYGAMVEQANYKNTTALMRAAQEGHAEIVELLIQHGANVNRKNHERMSSLMLASQRGHAKVVKLLIRAGAETDVKTAQDSTSLMLACKRDHKEVAKVLVASGCELMLRDSRGRTARDTAQRKGLADLANILTPTVQVDLMRREAGIERSYLLAKLWTLLQQERATVIVDESQEGERQMTIHELSNDLDGLFMRRMNRGKRALVQTMTMPAPVFECISSFLPYPLLWDKRLTALTNRCHIDPDSTVSCALDLIDEVLDEGGFVDACDISGLTPPPTFKDWAEWKSWGRKCDRARAAADVGSVPDDPAGAAGFRVTEAGSRATMFDGTANRQRTILCRTKSSSIELRRSVCFLQLLAHRSPLLARTLAGHPYNMPGTLIKRLKDVNDIQSLVRRMGSRGVHFDVGIAVELVMLASQVILWHHTSLAQE